ncbi:MAG: cytochrome c [Candidatus Brocadiaceae bacterium]|nr:cytochrome c [Candidatus Brocadiaceae bacterium]
MKLFRLPYIIPIVAGLGLTVVSSAWALTHHTPGDTTKSPYTIYAGLGFAVQESCYYCHGNGGAGTSKGKSFGVPDFTDAGFQSSKTDEQLIAHINKGSGKCPSYQGKMSPSMIEKMVEIVRNFAKK